VFSITTAFKQTQTVPLTSLNFSTTLLLRRFLITFLGMAVCAAIAPYEDARSVARRLVEEHGKFVEIFVNTPLEHCEARDRKGLYAKARAGELKGMTGIDDPYEAPLKCEIDLPSHELSVSESVDRIMEYLVDQGYVVLPGNPVLKE